MKTILKKALFILATVLTAPFWLIVHLSAKIGKDYQFFLSFGQLLSLAPGLTGVFFRRAYYAKTLENCADDCFIEFGTWFSHRNASLGSNVYIGARCIIGMAQIGDNSLIGSNVDILSGKNQHNFSLSDQTINTQGGNFEQIRIGSDCWIGNGSILMADVADKTVVGAGSVVVKPIPGNSIAVGNPAKVIRARRNEPS